MKRNTEKMSTQNDRERKNEAEKTKEMNRLLKTTIKNNISLSMK